MARDGSRPCSTRARTQCVHLGMHVRMRVHVLTAMCVCADGSYLAALLTQVVASLAKYKDRGAIIDDTPEVHGLCFVLEKIFVHELKSGKNHIPPPPPHTLTRSTAFMRACAHQDREATSGSLLSACRTVCPYSPPPHCARAMSSVSSNWSRSRSGQIVSDTHTVYHCVVRAIG
jgi:hypothetical protein